MPELVDLDIVDDFCKCCQNYCKIDGLCGVMFPEKQEECAITGVCEEGSILCEKESVIRKKAIIFLKYYIWEGEKYYR